LWRYLVPNFITAGSMLLGLVSIFQSMEGNYVAAAWLIVFAVCTDKLDGVAARLVRGTSELGVQLDSLADFLNFGIAPPVLIFASLGREPSLPFGSTTGRIVLIAACATWLLGAVYRLARFNLSTAQVPKSLCFGVPTTLMAGILATWFLALLKYTPADQAMAVDAFGGAKLFPFFETPAAMWRYLPLALFGGGVLMGSNLRMANLGGLGSRWFAIFVLANVLVGFILIPLKLYPEFLIWQPTAWVTVFLIWGQLSAQVRAHKSPPIFPRVPVDPTPIEEVDSFVEKLTETDDESSHQRDV
tara:strand:- start:3115 stop:4017 length:903 start_codon:yes stop_codon:yes gene_type:complete